MGRANEFLQRMARIRHQPFNHMKTLSKEWVESKLPNEDGQEIGAGCPASDLFGPVPTFRRWEFALTLDTWALPLCITRFRCGAVQIQFLCFELHTSIAHRWPNTQFSDEHHLKQRPSSPLANPPQIP